MIQKKIESIIASLEQGNKKDVQNAIFALEELIDENGLIPDQVTFELIDILRKDEMKESPFAGHLLEFFDFNQSRISPKAKDRCVGFLNAWGSSFTHFFSKHMVAMLMHGNYLK